MLVPVIAIVISVISLLKTNENTKREITIGKLEEMIEGFHFFVNNYKPLLNIYQKQIKYKLADKNADKLEFENLENDYKQSVYRFRQNISMEKFQEKTARMSVLSNCYLPDNEVKFKSLSVVTLITNLVNCTILGTFESSVNLFPKYPKPLDFMLYIDELEADILKEMKLGFKGTRIKTLYEYNVKFMEDLKISE